MSSFLYRLGRSMARRWVLVLVAWLALIAAGGGAAALLGQGTDDEFAIPGSQSQDTLDYLKRVFPQVSGVNAQMIVVVPDGQRVDTAETKAAVADTVKRLGDVDQVAIATDPFGKDVKDAVSDDKRAAIIAVPLTVDMAGVEPETRTELTTVANDLAKEIGDGAKVYAGGDAFSNKVPTLSITEALGVVVALVVLMLVFRSFLAAGMPLVTALAAVGLSVALVFAATLFTPVSSTAPMLAVMIGLAVGIDYALFLLSRHRDQLAEGMEVTESIARATATAGSAVIFAGLTVIIALLGLAVAQIPFLTTMGIAAAVAVAIAVLMAVTGLPALLRMAGERLRPRQPRRRRNRKPRNARKQRKSFATRWVRLATKVPLLTVVVIVVGMVICTIPAASLRLALPDNGTEEAGSPARVSYDVVAEHFGAGYNGPLLVTADIIGSTDPLGVVDDIGAEIEKLPGVASVPLSTPNPKGDTGIIQVVPTTGPDTAETSQLVERIRDLQPHFQEKYDVETAVTGLTAVGVDVSAQLGGALLPFGILVVGLSLILLAMVFRSIWVPIKATVGYLLSVGAAFGATSFVFVEGNFAELLHVPRTGSVISFLPIILMGVLFGLAMDYEVFLVSRIREEYVHKGDPHAAIETGFVNASKVVVAAAVIMFAVFAAFVPEGSATLKPIAFSLAVGVFVDAFVIRMTLVPAVLALLGRHAWWLPARLDKNLPVFDAEGDGLMRELRLADWPAPNSPEVVSAAGLRLGDDRDRTVFSGVDIHLSPGEILGIHSAGPTGKSALLYTLAGRVSRVDGDLKVLGQVLPEHAHAVRRKVALISCRDTDTAATQARAAIADGIAMLFLDDLDTVVAADQRETFGALFAGATTATGARVSFVFTCRNPALVTDLLPPAGVRSLALPTSENGAAPNTPAHHSAAHDAAHQSADTQYVEVT